MSPSDTPKNATLPGPCLRLRLENARTKGYNRKIKQIKCVALGFRNQQSYERRIGLNNAATAA